MNEPKVILVTGIMASGKSTVAQLLAERMNPSVHLRGDMFRKMIVNNRREMTPDAGEAQLEQLRLRYRLAAQAARTYAEAGFTVIVQDVVVGKVLDDFITYMTYRPFHVAVLCPEPGAVAEREANRGKKGYGAWTVEALDHVLREETPKVGIWLDSTRLTAEETAAELLKRLEGDPGIGGSRTG